MNPATAQENNSAIEGRIKAWLQQAGDRFGGRKRRHEASLKLKASSTDGWISKVS